MLKIKDKMQVLESEISLYDKKISDYQGELDKYSDKISGLKGLVYKNNNKLQDNTREITDLNYKISSLEENINNGGMFHMRLSVCYIIRYLVEYMELLVVWLR